MENTLISTIYSLEPVMACITQFSPNKIILIREEDAPDKIKEAERMLQETVGKVLEIESRPTSISNVVMVARDTAEIIVNPYSRDTEGIIRITIQHEADVKARHPESFAASQDIDHTA